MDEKDTTINQVLNEFQLFYQRGLVMVMTKTIPVRTYTVTKEEANNMLTVGELSIVDQQLYEEVLKLYRQVEFGSPDDPMKHYQKI